MTYYLRTTWPLVQRPYSTHSLAHSLPLPRPNNLLERLIHVWVEILLVWMLAQPLDRLLNPAAEWLGTMKLGNEPFDFRIVEDCGMGFVAFQIARQLRGDSADEISGDFHDQ